MARRIGIPIPGLLVLVSGAVVWALAPHIRTEYVRVSEAPVELQVAYSNETADPLCTKLYEWQGSEISSLPIFARVASDMPDPNDYPVLRQGDRITLTVYRYDWRETNLITGGQRRKASERVDVVAWRGPSTEEFTTLLDPSAAATFPSEGYIGCR